MGPEDTLGRIAEKLIGRISEAFFLESRDPPQMLLDRRAVTRVLRRHLTIAIEAHEQCGLNAVCHKGLKAVSAAGQTEPLTPESREDQPTPPVHQQRWERVLLFRTADN